MPNSQLRYRLANDFVMEIVNKQLRSFNRVAPIPGVVEKLNRMPVKRAMGIVSLMISYFQDHNPELAHEFVAYLAKDN